MGEDKENDIFGLLIICIIFGSLWICVGDFQMALIDFGLIMLLIMSVVFAFKHPFLTILFIFGLNGCDS